MGVGGEGGPNPLPSSCLPSPPRQIAYHVRGFATSNRDCT